IRHIHRMRMDEVLHAELFCISLEFAQVLFGNIDGMNGRFQLVRKYKRLAACSATGIDDYVKAAAWDQCQCLQGIEVASWAEFFHMHRAVNLEEVVKETASRADS